jgi:RNA polymerase sigma factor (TIGR02999 family)
MSDLSLTEQLQKFADGDREIAETVIREIMPELHAIAMRQLRQERYFAPLQATELINEIWIRLQRGGWKISSRGHFYSVSARAARQVLIDFARSRLAMRHGQGKVPASLDTAQTAMSDKADLSTLIHIGMLMDQLWATDKEAALVVDMHYFVGYTYEEVAEKTGLTLRQVRRRWKRGSEWLKDNI